MGDRLRLARIPADSFAAAGVVRPSRKLEPIKQHVEFSTSPSDLSSLPTDQTNLVVRALTLYRNKLAERDGGSLAVPRFRAHLVKQIPIDSGLGGGASNAATALFGANELCGRPASRMELAKWASELGSDVASFLSGAGTSLCTGRAIFLRTDRVQSVSSLAHSGGFFIISVKVSLSTPALFRGLEATNYSSISSLSPHELLAAISASQGQCPQLPEDAAFFVNDLEAPALQCSPELSTVHTRLLKDECFRVVAMSGAGPSFFAFGRPDGGETQEAFAVRFARECTEATGVQINVWPVQFAIPWRV
eukprot:CAMPEP_0183359478 /NCGR_PEP_ID=MMETSP0164_2-20130417/52320_1 /TAXON_ID=221442 /ORGANISM="Coccolithus pelagicus ssp braarudi, Strain PLY182g" /LENGTH=305 /DNA_ID=CAMNT_0025533597 /DNA_START=261 /DNA_END=1178 /DNA_ORIENTATION=-